jgi:UDP-GlcNAc:undecaprenyl-phosphate/decaprenyl-phosphate GlcNAc-1-phosphate transferase
MLFLILVFAMAFGISLFGTHRTRAWAIRANLVDVPDGDRHCHERPVPRLGGVAIFAAVSIVLLVAYLVVPEHIAAADISRTQVMAMILGGLAMFVLGIWDDTKNLGPYTKIAIETIIALCVFTGGLKIQEFTLLTGDTVQLSLPVSMLFTTVWLVGLANAFNLIDGSDGVAAGGALFASLTLAVVSLISGNIVGATIGLALAGATLGFLFFNFPPASIFLGDSGSLFLGYVLGAVGLLSTGKAPTVLAVAIPVVSCGLPILDTLLTMVRRFLRRDPIFAADRGHIHHRLRDLGHSPREVALVLYAGFAGFALLSLLLVQGPGPAVASVFIIAGGVLLVAVQRLKIPELLEVRRVVERGFRQRAVIAHNVRIRQAALDLRIAQEPVAILKGCGKAFTAGEFERVELCFYIDAYQFPLVPEFESRFDAASNRQRFVLADLKSGRPQWELQIPLRDRMGAPLGHLSLWQSEDAEHLLTDVRLLALHLQPELVQALTRLQASRLAAQAAELVKSVAQPVHVQAVSA